MSNNIFPCGTSKKDYKCALLIQIPWMNNNVPDPALSICPALLILKWGYWLSESRYKSALNKFGQHDDRLVFMLLKTATDWPCPACASLYIRRPWAVHTTSFRLPISAWGKYPARDLTSFLVPSINYFILRDKMAYYRGNLKLFTDNYFSSKERIVCPKPLSSPRGVY